MMNDIERILLTEQEIEDICKRLGEQISKEYAGKNPLIIGFLKGCAPFFSELIKRISIYCEIDFLMVSSYKGNNSTGIINIKKDVDQSIENRDVILVEDIVDTGNTLKKMVDLFKDRNPKSVKVVTLLDKPSNRKVQFKPDYIGYEIPNEFIVGYGLDYNERYRNLPIIGILKKKIYNK